jgi:hypothetical protein
MLLVGSRGRPQAMQGGCVCRVLHTWPLPAGDGTAPSSNHTGGKGEPGWPRLHFQALLAVSRL